MFSCTVDGIKWYSKFFGHDFPFGKYDQIFCPEFKYGAMENVGAVTFTENLLFRGTELDENKMTRFVNVVLHELCHQWFGNLVTMTWWNDLWLNEAFATYVSYLCMEQIPNLFASYPNLWIQLNSRKNWGYAEDEMSTSHPICKDAPHTDSAEDMINGITYGKGCAFLKQLYHLIGIDRFSDATKVYFSRHAWGNTTLPDFLDCLPGNVDGIDIKDWCTTFLHTKGVNVLSTERTNIGIKLTQTKGEMSDGLRTQKLDIAVFGQDLKITPFTVVLKDSEAVQEVAIPNIKNVYFLLNYGDHAYYKIFMEDKTTQFLSDKLSKVSDSLTRSLAWRSVLNMIKSMKIKSIDFFEFIFNNLKDEPQSMIISNMILLSSATISRYVPEERQAEIRSKMFDFTFGFLEKTDDLEKVKTLAGSVIGFAHSVEDIDRVLNWLEAGSILGTDGN
jgi:aminopeptidase N